MARAHIHRVTHDIIIPLILRQIPRWLNHTGRAVNHTGRLMWAWPALAVLSSLNRGGRWIQSWPLRWITVTYSGRTPTLLFDGSRIAREHSFPRRRGRSPIGTRIVTLCAAAVLLIEAFYPRYRPLCNRCLPGQSVINRMLFVSSFPVLPFVPFLLPKKSDDVARLIISDSCCV